MTVAQAIQRQLDRTGWTQQALADKLGVSRVTANMLLNGRQTLTLAMALRLEAVFGVEAERWLMLQMRESLEQVRAGK